MKNPVRILLVGAAGRMGQTIVHAAGTRTEIEIIARCDCGDSLDDSIAHCDVVVDFSQADTVERICAVSIQHYKAMVIGTTGHSHEQAGAIAQAAKSVPVVHAPNFSVGVNALFCLARKAVELLGDGFDLEIVETHHRHKKDAPSGTAKRLAQLLCDARGLPYDEAVVHGREGLAGERSAKEIGVHAIRLGDVIGEHTVVFAAAGERLELTHKASNRETFALGALRAASWIVGKPPRLYSMEDVLGI